MRFLFVLLLSLVAGARAAELRFDFKDVPAGNTPTNFRSMLAGTGAPGDWQIVMDEVPALLERLTDHAPSTSRRPVLAQLGTDPANERFPMLMFEGEQFADFSLTTRFKMVGGTNEQMAGIAFRIQDEKNFYVIRASALGRNIRFYKVVNGVRSDPIGPVLDMPKGVWHELKIICKGSEIRSELNGREAIPALRDYTFNSGRAAFWTKSDSVSYFSDTVINYKPKMPLAQMLVSDMMTKYPRIMALKIYMLDEAKKEPRLIASKDVTEVGQAGGKYEADVLENGEIFFAKANDHAELVMPLRDRNGDVVAALRVHLTTFPGQTEQNALTRATPILKEMQIRMQGGEDLR